MEVKVSRDQDEKSRDLEERTFLHEMATPLGAVIMLLDVMGDDASKASLSDEELREMSELIKQGSSAARRLKDLMQERREKLVGRIS